MEKRKTFYSILFIILAIIVVVVFWKNTPLLIASIMLLAIFKHRLIPIKIELLWFVISAFVGAGAESLVMLSGPWSYTNINILNFPLWLPFLWGLAGITGVTLYQGLTQGNQ